MAKLDGEAVGTIALKDIGDGAAQTLLDTALDHARAHGASAIWLGATEAFKAAYRFYEKNGFALVDADDLPASFPRMAVDTRFYRLNL
uniref:GNAT family N-acetyltransferase n=1 Tax=uncultured Caulobacter sp. TaxID=158749 RepID=UPI00345BEAFE